ncbi:hypothetical protein HGRIS_010353 [Hohenbuehelia grisea]|uniref:Uncharacterized protein n=1 Tax=Hohenbuehelia grisea TaxID=104357 RepID=A0ABR3J427_9AGAR
MSVSIDYTELHPSSQSKPLCCSCGHDQYSITSESIFTLTSAGSLYGIGSTAGKLFTALGKSVLWGLELAVIHRRLQTIQTRLTSGSNMGISDLTEKQMYVDLLELARPYLYPRGIRRRACGLLVRSILDERVDSLIEALVWLDESQPTELPLLIRELVVLPTTLIPGHGVPQNTRTRKSKKFKPAHVDYFGTRALKSLIRFATQVIRISTSACQAVIDAGYLDVLEETLLGKNQYVHAYVIRHWHASRMTEFNAALALSLYAIAAYPEHRFSLITHDICSAWSRECQEVVYPPMPRSESQQEELADFRTLYQCVCVLKLCGGDLELSESPFHTRLAKATHHARVNFFGDLVSHMFRITSVLFLFP